MSHHCRAIGCAVPTRPEMLMCLAHWRMVPMAIQRRVKATYRKGQCDDKQPSRGWVVAAHRAVTAIAERESVLLPEIIASRVEWADSTEAHIRETRGH